MALSAASSYTPNPATGRTRKVSPRGDPVKVPVDLAEVGVAFGPPRSLEVVSHHPGASGTWRLRLGGGDSFALKVLDSFDDWTRSQVVQQGQLESAASAAGGRDA